MWAQAHREFESLPLRQKNFSDFSQFGQQKSGIAAA
jgi:hypothetical protein